MSSVTVLVAVCREVERQIRPMMTHGTHNAFEANNRNLGQTQVSMNNKECIISYNWKPRSWAASSRSTCVM